MRSPRASLRIARTLLSTQYAYMLEYRAEIALWALSGV
ncbi:MAG: multidrug ABC transporter permease, partial [Cyanobacteria bacterium]|nr:multidrug ABC transporter permease [Cyanobacteriota bacterium]